MFFQLAKRGQNHATKYLLTILVVILAYIFGQVPLWMVLQMKVNTDPDIPTDAMEVFMENPDFTPFGISSNYGLFLMLLMFLAAMMVFILLVRHIHQKKLIWLITPNIKLNWKKMLFGFGVWLFIAILFEGISFFVHPELYSFNFNWTDFLVLLIIVVLLLPIQTSFEELFIRGYLLQGISILSKNRWIPLIVTSILFGLIHGLNPEIAKYGFWTMEMYYLSAGLILGFMTIMDDSLELALGVHYATNFFAATMVSYDGAAIQTDTLYKTSEVDPLLMFLSMAIGGIVFLFICSKKYKWKPISYILEPIKNEEDVQT